MNNQHTPITIPVFKQFLRLLRLYAKAVFNTFDKNLSPNVTVIRMRVNKKRLELDVQPMDAAIEPSIKEFAYTVESQLVKALKSGNEDILEKIDEDMASTVINNPDYNRKIFFVTDLVEMGDWFTMAFVDINREIYNNYYRLSDRNPTAPRSLLAAVSDEFNRDINKFLHQFSREDYSKSLDFQSTIQRGSKKLLKILGYAGLWDTTYDKLNKISSLNYEGKAIRGKILFTKKEILNQEGGHPNLNILMTFASRTPLSNYRHVRKLLELSKGNVCLISDSETIYGLGQKRGHYQMDREDLFEVEFTNYYTWELSHDNQKLMRVSHEHISLPKAKVAYDSFFYKLKQVFKDLDNAKIRDLYLLVMEAIKYNTGTLLVFSTNAASEARRLKNQCFQVEPILVSNDVIRSVINIDGAILMDLDGVCHGIGAILDGMATTRGDAARGARYNSAIRYVETISKMDDFSDCVAVVISDDGIIDIISRYTI